MSVAPLDQGDMYFDLISSFVLQADGTVDSNDCHSFTMLHPTYSQYSMHDSIAKRLIPCSYDPWTTVVEYQDPVSSSLVKIDLSTAAQTKATTAPSWGTPKSNSQQNMGWAYSEPVKEQPKLKDPFKKGAVLFHKLTRTKWVYDKVESSGYILRSFSDKSRTMNIFDRELGEFEEVFF